MGRPDNRATLTLIGTAISEASQKLRSELFNSLQITIEASRELSSHDPHAIELQLSFEETTSFESIRVRIARWAQQSKIDFALLPLALRDFTPQLAAFDMDSTLIQNEMIDELARDHGVYDEVTSITQSAMHGKMDFDESLQTRCLKLKGLPTSRFEAVWQRVQVTPGARELIRVLRSLGCKTAILSGGFTFAADKLKTELGMDFVYANTLETQGGILTGRVTPPIINSKRKADLLSQIAQSENISIDRTLAVGDGANDLLMLSQSGLGIAFHAKPLVREKAQVVLDHFNLLSIAYYLGLTRQEIESQLKL